MNRNIYIFPCSCFNSFNSYCIRIKGIKTTGRKNVHINILMWFYGSYFILIWNWYNTVDFIMSFACVRDFIFEDIGVVNNNILYFDILVIHKCVKVKKKCIEITKENNKYEKDCKEEISEISYSVNNLIIIHWKEIRLRLTSVCSLQPQNSLPLCHH